MSKLVQFKDKDGLVYPATQETELYNNASGANGSINLNESAANFKYIEIFFRNNDNDYSSAKIYEPNNKTTTLTVNHPTGVRLYLKNRTINITNKTITTVSGCFNEVYNATSGAGSGQITLALNNLIYITRVVGYK